MKWRTQFPKDRPHQFIKHLLWADLDKAEYIILTTAALESRSFLVHYTSEEVKAKIG
jgi:hypothetical protein